MSNKEVTHPNCARDEHHWEAQPETQRKVDCGVWYLESTVRSRLIITFVILHHCICHDLGAFCICKVNHFLFLEIEKWVLA